MRPTEPRLVYERLSDPILVTRAKDGDRQALAALCERHAARVESLALHLLRDPEEARDAAQESLAKLCVRIRQFRGESQFSTWLHRLVVNTCKDMAQAKLPRPPLPPALHQRPPPDGAPLPAPAPSQSLPALAPSLSAPPPA